jgi:hypothetical protein
MRKKFMFTIEGQACKLQARGLDLREALKHLYAEDVPKITKVEVVGHEPTEVELAVRKAFALGIERGRELEDRKLCGTLHTQVDIDIETEDKVEDAILEICGIRLRPVVDDEEES